MTSRFPSQLLLVLVLSFHLSAQAQPPREGPVADVFYQDFRLQPELSPRLTYFGPDPLEVSRFEKEGLRITFPRVRKHPDRVGVELKERIKGNFEITAAYEIIKGGQPKEGYGVGVELFVATESPTKEELAVFRVARVNEGEVHLTSRVTTEAGKPRYLIRSYPTECTFGRLKITRVGKEATLWAAEGDAKEFQELGREDLGPDDVTVVRIGAYPGHKQNELDVRIKDLRVRGIQANEVVVQPLAPSAPNKGLWLLLLVLGVLTVIGGLAGAFLVRRLTRTEESA